MNGRKESVHSMHRRLPNKNFKTNETTIKFRPFESFKQNLNENANQIRIILTYFDLMDIFE